MGDRSPALLGLLVAIALGACGMGPAAVASAPVDLVAALDGRTFLATTVTGRAFAPGSEIRLAFAGDRVTATGGCNEIVVRFAVHGGRLEGLSGGSTTRQCAAEWMVQDGWVEGLMNGGRIALDGDRLQLSDEGGRLFLDEVGPAGRPSTEPTGAAGVSGA